MDLSWAANSLRETVAHHGFHPPPSFRLAPFRATESSAGAARTPLFITNSRYDGIVCTPAIPTILYDTGHHAVIDEAARPDVTRPGWFTLDVPADDGSVRRTEVRFPP